MYYKKIKKFVLYTPRTVFSTHQFETGKCSNKKSIIITFSAVKKYYTVISVQRK